MRRCEAALVTAAVAAVMLTSAALADQPPGWAPGGSPGSPGSQEFADRKDMPRNCSPNSALLFRVRGSGEDYGSDRLGQWASAAGDVMIRGGWRVRDMQAIYPAPEVPPFGVMITKPAVLKRYRDVATKWAPRVRAQITSAYKRCKVRSILLAGYSQGNIVLRAVIPKLPVKIRSRIVSVDLFADPTADASVDRVLQHPRNLDGRLTAAGIDTVGARTLWKLGTARVVSFRQTAYPLDVTRRVYQYCMEDDLVCDFRPTATKIAVEGRTHKSYAFTAIGVRAAKRLLAGITISLGRSLGRQSVALDGVPLTNKKGTVSLKGALQKLVARYGMFNQANCLRVPESANTPGGWLADWDRLGLMVTVQDANPTGICSLARSSGRIVHIYASPALLPHAQAFIRTRFGSFHLRDNFSSLPVRLRNQMSLTTTPISHWRIYALNPCGTNLVPTWPVFLDLALTYYDPKDQVLELHAFFGGLTGC